MFTFDSTEAEKGQRYSSLIQIVLLSLFFFFSTEKKDELNSQITDLSIYIIITCCMFIGIL